MIILYCCKCVIVLSAVSLKPELSTTVRQCSVIHFLTMKQCRTGTFYWVGIILWHTVQAKQWMASRSHKQTPWAAEVCRNRRQIRQPPINLSLQRWNTSTETDGRYANRLLTFHQRKPQILGLKPSLQNRSSNIDNHRNSYYHQNRLLNKGSSRMLRDMGEQLNHQLVYHNSYTG